MVIGSGAPCVEGSDRLDGAAPVIGAPVEDSDLLGRSDKSMTMQRMTAEGWAGLGRRRLLAGGAAACGGLLFANALAWPATARAAAIPPAQRMPFSVRRGDDFIGEHVVSFRRDGNRVEVSVAAAFQVKIAFITAWRYTHQNREVWEDGRLISVDSTTDDDGTARRVTARATAAGLEVDGRDGRFTVPADTVSTSWWNAEVVNRSEVLDTQNGVMRAYDVAAGPLETVTAAGRPVRARGYTLSGDFDLRIWYSEQDQWVKMRFDARGEPVHYRLQASGAVLVGAS